MSLKGREAVEVWHERQVVGKTVTACSKHAMIHVAVGQKQWDPILVATHFSLF